MIWWTQKYKNCTAGQNVLHTGYSKSIHMQTVVVYCINLYTVFSVISLDRTRAVIYIRQNRDKFNYVTFTIGIMQRVGKRRWKADVTVFQSGFEKPLFHMSVLCGAPACPSVTLLTWHSSYGRYQVTGFFRFLQSLRLNQEHAHPPPWVLAHTTEMIYVW